jgi:hypothetical protein
MFLRMPSRGAARKPRQPLAKAKPILTETLGVKLDRLVERLLYAVGLSPDSLEGLTQEQLRLKLLVVFAATGTLPLSVKASDAEPRPNIRTPDVSRQTAKATKELVWELDEKQAEWLLKEVNNLPPGRILQVDPDSGKQVLYILPNKDRKRLLDDAVKELSPRERSLLPELLWNKLTAWTRFQPSTAPAPERAMGLPEQQNHERQMAQDENIIIKPDGTLVKGGIPHRAVSEAAPQARAHRTTILRWLRDKTKFEGRPLQSYYFAPAHTYFISEESIQRLANRFLKWPSGDSTGAVTLGETKDKNGFIGMSEAADIVGVSRRTMWLWVSQGKAPTSKPLDVIQCPASDHFYIREKDAYELKKLVPRSGLQRGRRPPQLVPQP